MDFYALLDQVVDLLWSRQHVIYRTLKRQSDPDDAALEDLNEELLFAHPQIVDEEGQGLVWAPAPAPSPASPATAPSALAVTTARNLRSSPPFPQTAPRRF